MIGHRIRRYIERAPLRTGPRNACADRSGRRMHQDQNGSGRPPASQARARSSGFAPDADFVERFARARRTGWVVRGEQLPELAQEARGTESMPEVAAIKLQIDTEKWLLSRMLPDTFGDRLNLAGNVGGSATINVYLPSKGEQPSARVIDTAPDREPYLMITSKAMDQTTIRPSNGQSFDCATREDRTRKRWRSPAGPWPYPPYPHASRRGQARAP
jgi:hypothetical protein